MTRAVCELVTGATGFVGGHLAASLSRHGARVRALVRRGADLACLRSDGVELSHGDLRDGASLAGVCRGVERVFHVAATQRFELGRAELMDINVGGTERLCREALASDVPRFVLISSGGIHRNASGRPLAEDAPQHPANSYLESKIRAEAVARAMFQSNPGRLTIVRPGTVYGAGCRRLLKLFRAVVRRRFVMIGPGTRLIHPVHVDDLIDGLLKAGGSEGRGRTFLMSGPRALTLRAWVDTIARAAGVPPPRWRLPLGPFRLAAPLCEWVCRPLGIAPPLNRRRLGFFIDHRNYDLTRARRLLAYRPAVDPDEGARRSLDDYAARGWL
jgi:nucleoside-diphosphate-sugar epimerase